MNSDDFWAEVARLMTVTPDPVIEYRWYHDAEGNITNMYMQAPFPAGDNYIIVDKTHYDNYVKYKVVDQKPALINNPSNIKIPLVKSDKGFRVVKNNAALLLLPEETFTNIEYYEPRRNY